MLKLSLEFSDVSDVNDTSSVFKDFLKEHKQEICEYMSNEYKIDPSTYEGGIDDWFGLGSVLLFELGIETTIHHSTEEVVLILK